MLFSDHLGSVLHVSKHIQPNIWFLKSLHSVSSISHIQSYLYSSMEHKHEKMTDIQIAFHFALCELVF